MKNIYEKIEALLKQRPLDIYELMRETGHSYDGLRGRLSEMRKMGYDIKLKPVEVRKYVLTSKPSIFDLLDSYREWTFEEENYMRENFFTVPFPKVCKKLNRPKEDVKRKAGFMGMM
jgi:hypothetical protein